MHEKENKKKGPVEPEKEEEEEDKLERFSCHLHEFHNPLPNAPVFAAPLRYQFFSRD